ncbi:MAG: phosphoglycerate dehydrogenase, partial [Mycobacteriaceae bacterium]|nr:phosphoglycerate dehydrogenase [Mycobacteriaceae bacterium]
MSLPVVLIADKLAESTVAALGDQVEVRWVDGPNRDELLAAVPDADALLVRSATKVDADVLNAGARLKIVARAGVGLDNVDVDAATARGILVVNAPTSNIHSAAEHAVALLLAAARQIPAADASLREHTWKRSAFSGTEIFGKTVGVVGLGRIGQLVAQRLAAFGAHLVAYDPYVSAARAAQLGIELVSLDELLGRADFISVHLPKTPETAGLIGKEALAKTKPGVIIVNAARGGLVDETALAEAIASGHVQAAGLDVFATEPCTDSPLFELAQVVVTPHLGASTSEAQDRAGVQTAEQVVAALTGGVVSTAVNIPAISAEDQELLGPFVPLCQKLGTLAMELAGGSSVERIEAEYLGRIAERDTRFMTLGVLMGALTGRVEDEVNLVNAPTLAAQRGIDVRETRQPSARDFTDLVRVTVRSGDGAVRVVGTLVGHRNRPHLLEAWGA